MIDRLWRALIIVTLMVICLAGLILYRHISDRGYIDFIRYRYTPNSISLVVVSGMTEQCKNAPFISPTNGWIGVLYGDNILGTVNHSGLDIFGLEENGTTPVYAAYDGYLTRMPEWISAVIIRHPEDPLMPGRQIWTYYTHLADTAGNSYIIKQIPPGTFELPVKQGTLLGYQGDYNGGSSRHIDTHTHFSIVRDNGNGSFLNETDITNTIDPSPYFGMRLNSSCGDRPPVCRPDLQCR